MDTIADEDELVDHLMRRFYHLHREGNLEEAVTISYQGISIMESRRRRRKKAAMNGVVSSSSDISAEGFAIEKTLLKSTNLATEDSAIAEAMNDLGCTLQQVWRGPFSSHEKHVWFDQPLILFVCKTLPSL